VAFLDPTDLATCPHFKWGTTHRNNWNEQERWVWKEVCEGREANLNQREGHQLQPNNPDNWSRSRILRPTFLEAILLHEPYRGTLTHRGVRIKGGWFVEPLDLSETILTKPLGLKECRFDENVILSHLETPSWISFGGSALHGILSMHRLKVGGSLRLKSAPARRNQESLLMKSSGDITAPKGNNW
jgi:hypothetical protein